MLCDLHHSDLREIPEAKARSSVEAASMRVALLTATAAILLAFPGAAGANEPPSCTTPWVEEVEPDVVNELDPIFGFQPCHDPDGFELTFTVVDPPQHGTATPRTLGFSYTPVAGYRGPDSFTFRVTDALLAESNLATVQLTVLEPNRPPECAPTVSLSVAPGGSLPLDHHVACSDPDGDDIFPLLVSGPSHGALTILLDGVLYSPDAGYVGLDQIVYQVQDDRGAASNVSTLTITVGLPPGPPVPAPPPPATQPDDRVAPAISAIAVVGQRLRRLRTKGLQVVLRSSEPAVVTLELTVDRATARRLGLKRKPAGPVAVGSLRRSLVAGSTALNLKLTSATRKALRPARKVTLRLKTVAIDAAGNRGERNWTFTVTR
jgi:Bacterial Ig domain